PHRQQLQQRRQHPAERRPPQAGPSVTLLAVNDGTGADAAFQTSTTIAANWDFAAAGVAGYQWAVGTAPGAADVQGFTGVGLATSASSGALPLAPGSTYYVTVRGIDGLGNPVRAVTSDGVSFVTPATFLPGNRGTFTDDDGDRYTVTLTPAAGRLAVFLD